MIVLDEAQASAVHDWYRVPDERIRVLANGVHDQFFSNKETDEIKGRPYRLLYVGRLSGEKNVNRLLETVALLSRPFELVIAGDGEQGDALRRRASGRPGIRFVGQQSGEALVDWYRWADVLVSTSDGEGMPLVFLEAMAAGVPIVGTDVPGSRETLAGVGMVVPPSAPALAEALESLADDLARRRDMAAAGRHRVAGRSWQSVADRLEKIYREMV